MDAKTENTYTTKLSFLYASISDMQAVIRAIDTKVSAMLVILSVPLTKLAEIHVVALKVLHEVPWISNLLLAVFILAWLAGFYAALMTLIAVDDPRRHINGSAGRGTFYCGHLYKSEIIDAFLNRSDLLSRSTWDAHSASLPQSDKEIFDELSFEQMKLAYIRTVKLRRAATAYFSAIVWMATGACVWLLGLSV